MNVSEMTPTLWLQWGLLVGNSALLLAAVVVGGLRPRVRPWAFAVGVLAAAHVVYYALFLIWPDAMGPQGTMLFSISLRYMVMFMVAFLLLFAAGGRPWNR